MLTDEDRVTLREDELYRKSVRDEFSARPPSWRTAVLSVDTLKWLTATVAIPLAAWIYGQAQISQNKASLDAQAQVANGRKDVDQLTALLPGLASSDPRQRTVALSVLAGLVSLKTASPTVRDIYTQVSAQALQDQKSGDDATAAAGAATQAALLRGGGAAPVAAGPAQPEASQARPVAIAKVSSPASVISADSFVYTQIYAEAQRSEANRLSDALRAQGVPVLGVQNVGRSATPSQLTYAQRGRIDIRFYHATDKDAALSLVPIIQRVSPSFGEPTVHDLSQRKALGKPGTLEIWYPCAAQGVACQAGG